MTAPEAAAGDGEGLGHTRASDGRPRVVILGAGILGLKVANALASRGVHVTLVEKDDTTGGMCASTRAEGLTFDLGPHFFYTASERGFRFIREEYAALLRGAVLDLGNLINRSLILTAGGKYTRFPLRPGPLLRSHGVGYLARCGADIMRQRGRRRPADNLHDTLTRKFGRLVLDDMLESYIRKSTGLPSRDVATEWASERESFIGSGGLLRFLRENLRLGVATQRGHCYPERGGAQTIPLAYERGARNAGARILTGCRLAAVNTRGDRVESVEVAGRRELSLAADVVVSTVPLLDLVRALTPSVSPSVRAAASRLEYRGLVLVFLSYPAEKITDAPQIYVGTDSIPFKRLSIPQCMSSHMGKPGTTGICLEICCSPTDHLWEQERTTLYELGRSGIERMGLGLDTGKLEGVGVRRLRHAYPIYRRRDIAARDHVLSHLARVRNLLTRGRQGEFRYNVFTYESFLVARETTGQVLEMLGDRTSDPAQ